MREVWPVPGDYAVLAPVYDDIGLGDFAQRMTPVLIDFAQQRDWLGRRITVLGCGTGASIDYLSQFMFTVTGIDSSPEMLAVAQQKFTEATNAALHWAQADIRELKDRDGTAEMVLALNVLNELNSLRDLELVFTHVQRMLEPEKLFIFDLITIQGLSEQGHSTDGVIVNNDRLTAFNTNQFDYERQMAVSQYILFRRQGDAWQRSQGQRVLRGFPVQAVASLVQRAGLKVSGIFQLNLTPYDPGVSQAARVIFLAEKP